MCACESGSKCNQACIAGRLKKQRNILSQESFSSWAHWPSSQHQWPCLRPRQQVCSSFQRQKKQVMAQGLIKKWSAAGLVCCQRGAKVHRHHTQKRVMHLHQLKPMQPGTCRRASCCLGSPAGQQGCKGLQATKPAKYDMHCRELEPMQPGKEWAMHPAGEAAAAGGPEGQEGAGEPGAAEG